MNHDPAQHQDVQIILTFAIAEDMTMADINTITDGIVNLIRNFLRKLLRLRYKICIKPVILDVVPLPFKNPLIDTCN